MLSVSPLIESITGCRQAVGFGSQWLERLGDAKRLRRAIAHERPLAAPGPPFAAWRSWATPDRRLALYGGLLTSRLNAERVTRVVVVHGGDIVRPPRESLQKIT
jgi:hypothetical protein